MTDVGGGAFRKISRARELPDYTAFTWPAATVTDTSSEEIEIDQALSLAGRRGRRLLGVQYGGMDVDFATERITITADIDLAYSIALNTRTGSHALEDPEFLWGDSVHEAINVTESSSQLYRDRYEIPMEGEVYVAPRLFWRVTNNMDSSWSADQFGARIASINQRLSFQLFIELLERFADVTLL